MKIFKLNDCDWYAAEDMESAIQQIMDDTGQNGIDCVELDAHELTDEELDKLVFVDDMENGRRGPSRSFREQLALMVERGDSFPCPFATTEF